ncbi:ATP-dependent metallopeptidase FtsH/Yme1/Tma family protein [Helicobacter mesocricetorum]|uniref:ATP-dependent metallopeptidase FtsH/Yme1/Tma family protein n=1 Tax=Helicobacter mesocricetorum TaxID=87012 RepID=UPI000CF04FD5|nr:ATP-dependent metallopeptidase FtsH/Yme1/Tma family protein [Helicobacter mesocricetorum]
MHKSKYLIFGICLFISALILLAILSLKDNATLISNSELHYLMQDSLPNSAKIKGDYLFFKINHQSYKIAKDSVDLKGFGEKIPIEITTNSTFLENLDFIVFIGVIVICLLLFAKNPQYFKKPSKNISLKDIQNIQTLNHEINESFDLAKIKSTQSNITFEDVAGISEAKEELEEIIDYLKSPQKYQNFGVKLPKGVLLIGPPGVGKTLIARALAGEAGVPFFYQSGASFVQIYVGMGAKRVRDLFTKAKLNAPSIIFIDEIDAVGKARGGMRNDEREATLNQLLTEMDGFEDSKGVIVIGATNNIDSMDEALLRSGRFDRRIFVELPNLQERIKILKVHCRDKNYDFNLEEIARLCVGFSGAGIASLINEAALNAIKRNSTSIQKEDILSVRDKVMIGVKKKLSFNEKEKEILAFYQAAKAFSAYHLEIPFEKATLMSDGLKYLDKEFSSKNELENQIKVHLSGIAALKLLYDEYYSHSKEDLNIAKNIAKKMVESYGMGEYLIGSEEDILKILENCKIERIEFFKNYQNLLNAIQKKLLQNEKLEYQEIGELIHATL